LRVAIGNDHAGITIKPVVVEWLTKKEFEITDFGTDSPDPVDYSDFAHRVAEVVESGEYDMGVLICGSGQGASLAANKHQGIRAALCWIPEIARLARSHNDANILCLPGRFVDIDAALAILEKFFTTPFEGGRHQRRIEKIPFR
jgi:ribose 5-phosphate isomerase B